MSWRNLRRFFSSSISVTSMERYNLYCLQLSSAQRLQKASLFAQSSWKRGWWIPVSQGMCLGQKTSLRALSTSFKALFSPKTTRKQTRCHGNQVTLLSKLQFITIYEQNIDKKTILPKNWIIKDVNTSKKIFRQFLIKIAFFLYSTTLNRIQETSSHCSLIPIFSFLILPKISLYTQLFPAFLLSLHSVGTRLTPHSVGLIRLRIA